MERGDDAGALVYFRQARREDSDLDRGQSFWVGVRALAKEQAIAKGAAIIDPAITGHLRWPDCRPGAWPAMIRPLWGGCVSVRAQPRYGEAGSKHPHAPRTSISAAGARGTA